MTLRSYSYIAYGLRFRTEIALPFCSASSDEPPDVTVRVGTVPDALVAPVARGRRWQAAPGAFLFDMEGIARYLITNGREIAVEPTGGNETDVRTFLLGSVLSACLQQRGLLTLHASGVETEAGAVLFAGRSGSGKSTLLAALIERGYAMLADDVIGIRLDACGRPIALSAFPAVRLGLEAVAALAWRTRTAEKAQRETDKHVLPIERFRVAPLGVHTVLTLRTRDRDTVEVRPVSPGGAAARMIVRHTHRRRFLNGLGGHAEYLRCVAALATQVRPARILRPAHAFSPDRLAREVERYLRMERGTEAGPRRIGPGEATPQARPLAAGRG